MPIPARASWSMPDPATGKTATAAARVLALLSAGIAPEQVWMVSFARAAVAEMRQRLLMLGGPDGLGRRVTTLDSLAWRLRSDEPDADVAWADMEGSYDAAIGETLSYLRTAPQGGSLSTLRHIVFDETQDLVGLRARLTVAILNALPGQAGATVLTDEAQAIYGFAGDAVSFEGSTVAAHLLETESAYRLHRLSIVHRTDDPRLLRLFAVAREAALNDDLSPGRRLSRVGRIVRRAGRPNLAQRLRRAAPDDDLVLFRTRAEVLAAAAGRVAVNRPYRLRLSGVPDCLDPLIGRLLAEEPGSVLSATGFAALWRERVGEENAATHEAWERLWRATQGSPGRLDLARLRLIARTRQPPAELCRFDPGDPEGPILGTIHASKGREAGAVRLHLGGVHGRDDPDEEARVLFVAASRARQSFRVERAHGVAARHLQGGRVLLPLGVDHCRLEVGRARDFHWMDPAIEAAVAADRAWNAVPGSEVELAWTEGRLVLRQGERMLGIASEHLLSDLRAARALLAGSTSFTLPSGRFGPVPLLASRTLALDPTTLPRHLPEAIRRTGLLIVPMVFGLADVKFTSV